MGYKQENSPFSKLSKTKPRINVNAFDFEQKSMDDIVNKTADGIEIITDKSGSDDKKPLDGMNTELVEGIKEKNKQGTGMYKQNDMDNKKINYGNKQIRSKGGAFPMVAQTPQVDAYGNESIQPNRAGRGSESNQLTNNPNIQQPANKVSNSTFNTNQKFGNIASDAGTPHMPGTMMPEHKTGYTPAYGQPAKELVGDQYKLPGHIKANIKAAPGMYGDNAHTKVTKSNVKASEKDDAAHIDYLKRDINYDNKHGGSSKQMTNDEKHISKLAGDIKYDHKHHGRKYDNV